MNPNYYDEYKKQNYWNQRYRLNPNGSPTLYLKWYYNYFYPYTRKNINPRQIHPKGYLNTPRGLYMGHAPNGY